jgi:putative DNA methylase
MSLIARIDWAAVDAKTSSEQAKRECHAPWVGVFRWWARRPSSVVGALLDAGRCHFGDKYLVSDVFSGGGTVGFEAAARHLPVYAQDLYPWAANGLATGLQPTNPDAFSRAAAELLEALKAHRTAYACADGSELSHILRVRTAQCLACERLIHLFRNNLVSMQSRSPGERRGFMGCVGCGKVSLRSVPVDRFTCDHCGLRSRSAPMPVRGRPRVLCPHCRHVCPLADLLQHSMKWTPVLVQEVRAGQGLRPKTTIRPPRDTDPVLDNAVRPRIPHVNAAIPRGLETDFLLRDGYRTWSDLYTNRQLRILKSALHEIDVIRCTQSIKERLRVAVVGACEMATYLCRWEAHYPKAIEAVANHRYARITVSAETNLLSEIGRGTLPRRLAAAQKAAAWWKMIGDRSPVRIVEANRKRRHHPGGVLVAVGSSTRQLLVNGQVDLIITDPPYHDDVQYGELARLFHAWFAVAGDTLPVQESEEVVPNKHRGRDTAWYRDTVADCLREGRRTLSKQGRLILTYHNNDLKAWLALGQALSLAGFRVVALAVAAAENPVDHSKRGRKVFLHDLVIECRPATDGVKPPKPLRVGRCDTNERQNLQAIGLVLSDPSKCEDLERFRQHFSQRLKQLGGQTALIS